MISHPKMAPKQWLWLRTVVGLLLLVAVVVASNSSEPDGGKVEDQARYLQDGTQTLQLITNYTHRQGNICGSSRPRRGRSSHRIAGGYQATLGEYPSYVQVQSRLGSRINSCGGTIISDRMILTAAHCFNDRGITARTITITAGSVDAGSGTRFRVSQLCLPAENRYNQLNYDVAILITERAIAFNNYIQPACMPSVIVTSSYQAHVVGFGLTAKRPILTRARRLQVLPVQRTNRCPGLVGSNVVCFVSNQPSYRGDACEGDSGGPVYTNINGRQSVVGVVSRGINNCQAGRNDPGVYMNVYALIPKLRETVNQCRRM